MSTYTLIILICSGWVTHCDQSREVRVEEIVSKSECERVRREMVKEFHDGISPCIEVRK